MSPIANLDHHQLESLIPLIVITLGIMGVVLPALTLNFTRRVMREQEHLTGPAIAGASLITIAGLIVGGIVVLALIGWLPSPRELIHLSHN